SEAARRSASPAIVHGACSLPQMGPRRRMRHPAQVGTIRSGRLGIAPGRRSGSPERELAMRIRIIVLVGLIAAVSVGGCGAEDVVTTAPDCTDVCDRYEECFDDDFDVVGCTADCADASIDDEDFQDRLDDC